MNITIIGNGSQSKRIFNILKKKNYKKIKFFNPRYKKSDTISNDKNLLNSDVIFICSPNHTHLNYIKSVNKKSFIFCEKPPVNNIKDLKKLLKINLKKIYFNFNERFNLLTSLIKSNRKKLGNMLYANIVVGPGISSERNFVNTWRGNKKKTTLGVYEILNIHFIDLINNLFGINKINSTLYRNKSGIVVSAKSTISAKFNVTVDIFCSFNVPFVYYKEFLFENGIIRVKPDGIYLYYPKITKDKYGRFKEPELKKKFKVSYYEEYNNSLIKSVNYFLKHVKSKTSFSKKELNKSLTTTKFFLNKKNKVFK